MDNYEGLKLLWFLMRTQVSALHSWLLFHSLEGGTR
jgi:hypothetical protein